MVRGAIYTRLSQDRDGTKEGADRQEGDCRDVARREGVPNVEVFRNDDRSAYNGKPRPEFERMLRELHRFDVLIYWKTDRLVRRSREFWRVIDACEKTGTRLLSVVDPIDTSSPIGKGVAGMVASMGEQESYNTSVRVKRMHEENAKKGRPHGGRRAFGYERDGVTVNEAEAKVIREARDRLLRGESLNAIASDFNRRGIKPTTADAWRVTALREMLKNARIAGLRQHQGVVVGDAAWPAIITPDDHDKILAMIKANTRPRSGRRPEYLLTAILTCSGCGKPLRSSLASNGSRSWACRRTAGEEGRCGRLSIMAEPVDDLLVEGVLRKLESRSVVRAMQRPPARGTSHKDRDDLDKRLVQLGKDHDQGLISRAEWLARRGPLQQRLEAAQASFDREAGADALARFADRDPRKLWPKLTLDEQRAILRVLIDHVYVGPGVRGVRSVDPRRLRIEWRKSIAR